ncbi:MAG: YqeG family HAD IIIA-type phosphatase [Mycoplasma sp.]
MKSKFSYLNYLRPNLFQKSIADINVHSIRRSGIKYVLCDLDNTLVPHFTKLPNSLCMDFLNSLNDEGIKVIIVSNNSKKRVEKFCDHINVFDFIYNTKKPFIYKVKKIIKKYNIMHEDVLVIGDQFITDVIMANRLQFKSILVLPLVDSVQNNFQNIIIAILDKLVYKYISHSNLINENKKNKLEEKYDII